MSALVEEMFSVRQVPWHKLGKIIETAPTSKDAIVMAGLDWNVIQKEVYTENGILIPGYKANVRETDGRVLGMVTNKYKVIQNAEAFEFTDSLLGEGVTYETAGSLSSGRRVWMLANLEDRLICEEKVSPYLVFTNSHDGTGAVRVAITPVRVVCQNTLNLALKTASRQWSCPHMGDIESRLEEAKRTLENAETYIDALDEEFGELKLQKVTDDDVVKYIEWLIPIKDEAIADKSDRKVINLLEARDEIMYRYKFAPDLRWTEKTAFRFINAVSDYATHHDPARHSRNYQENLMMKTVDGNVMIDKALTIVKSVAA